MIVFTDPHGCFLTFKKLFETIKEKYPEEQVCVAGDLIDRGPRSNQLIQFCIDNKIDCIRGNHEEMLIDETIIGIKDSLWINYGGIWYANGGLNCYNSYLKEMKIDPISNQEYDIPYPKEFDIATFKLHREWINKLPYYLEYKDIKNERGQYLLITHAAATEVLLDGIIATKAIIWNRQLPKKLKDRFNVFGHTPQDKPIITKYYANIDTGCCFKGGKLTALRFPEMEIFQQENIDYE